MADEASVDPAALERLRRLGGEKFVKEMIDIFLDFIPKKIAQALEGQRANCLLEIEKGAHAVKSSALNMGAQNLQRLADRIERLAKEQQPELLPALLADLESEFSRVRAALQEHQRSLSSRTD